MLYSQAPSGSTQGQKLAGEASSQNNLPIPIITPGIARRKKKLLTNVKPKNGTRITELIFVSAESPIDSCDFISKGLAFESNLRGYGASSRALWTINNKYIYTLMQKESDIIANLSVYILLLFGCKSANIFRPEEFLSTRDDELVGEWEWFRTSQEAAQKRQRNHISYSPRCQA